MGKLPLFDWLIPLEKVSFSTKKCWQFVLVLHENMLLCYVVFFLVVFCFIRSASSNRYPQCMFLWRYKENIWILLLSWTMVINPCHAELIKLPCPLLIFSQSDYLIQIVDINSHTEWQTVQIQISWLLQKPTDLDLHCLQRQGMSGISRTRVNRVWSGTFIWSAYWILLDYFIHHKCSGRQTSANTVDPN